MKKILFFIFLLAILLGSFVGAVWVWKEQYPLSSPSFSSNKPATSSPETGFLRENTFSSTSTLLPADLPTNIVNKIRSLNLVENQKISSPVVVEGEAQANWFGEGRFPVHILDKGERIIGLGVATVKEQDSAEDFLSFIATVDFSVSEPQNGFVVLRKSAAGGGQIKEQREEIKISVQLLPMSSGRESGGCRVTGCSSQVCSDQDVITDCLYKEEYICYQKAKCERQSDGRCGWTETKELKMCLDQFS